MRIKITILIFLFISIIGKSQNDTINQRDENNLKQGYWVYYGKDRPESGYPENGKIEEGRYVNDRKEGFWIKYHIDGITPKMKGAYLNNRPNGKYWKYNLDGTERDSGTFEQNNFNLIRGQGANQSAPKDSLLEFQLNNSNDTIQKNEKSPEIAPKIRGCVTGTVFKENGYNKVYNENDEIWQDGEFKNGKLCDGKVYLYDSDGILVEVKVYKAGLYHSSGQL